MTRFWQGALIELPVFPTPEKFAKFAKFDPLTLRTGAGAGAGTG